ncbi:uncharacterized protein F5147DRAFT_588554, partial [Suillus discolor]
VYCVHWLRVKALMDHWKEELLLVQHEMNWTSNFFLHKAEQWIHLSITAQDTQLLGHIAYAAWQGKMYWHLYEDVMDEFRTAKSSC